MHADLKRYLDENWEQLWHDWRETQTAPRPNIEVCLRDAPSALRTISQNEREEFCRRALYAELFHLHEVHIATTPESYVSCFNDLCSDPRLLVASTFQDLQHSVGSTVVLTSVCTELQPEIDGFSELQLIGRGASGEVFRATQEGVGGPVAIKILHRDDRSGEIISLLKEAEILGKLRGVNGVITIFHCAKTKDGRECIVSQFIDGVSLDSVVERASQERKAIDPAQAATFVLLAARAIHGAHVKGIWHRDIKPANLLLESNGRIWVSDFGLALIEEDFDLERGPTIGSPAYMSPEQARGESNAVNARSDVFSLGMVLNVLLTAHTGRVPWHGSTGAEVVIHRATHPPLPPRELDSSVPARLNKIVAKAISVDREHRHATALDLAQELEAWLNPPSPEQVTRAVRMASGATLDAPTGPPAPTSEYLTLSISDVVPHLVQQCHANRLAILIGGLVTTQHFHLQERLVAHLQNALKKPDTHKLADLANLFVDKAYHSTQNPVAAKKQLVSIIQRLSLTPTADLPNSDGHDVLSALSQLPVNNFFTTSWDRDVQESLTRVFPSLEAFDNQLPIPLPDGSSKRRLIHLHGTMYGPLDHLVVASQDFESYYRNCHYVYQYLSAVFEGGMTLLCLGCSPDELVDFEYLRHALSHSRAPSQIYAVLPGISDDEAERVWRTGRVSPISGEFVSIDSGEAAGELVAALLARNSATSSVSTSTKPATESTTSAAIKSDIQEEIQNAQQRMTKVGESPESCFTNFRPDLPKPPAPPSHHQLNSVYVERGLKDWIIQKLEKGENAGVTGLLGIGGVGKTYLALHIAHEMKREWEVIWVSLLQQGTDDALDGLARAYGLEFRPELQPADKIVALRWLFAQLKAAGRRPLAVLDNAERFPRIDALFHALIGVPVLVTSRTEEGSKGWIEYRRLEPMNAKQGMELCQLLLEKFGNGQYQQLADEDRADLADLCEYLGGHPLGIRLVIEGYLNQPESSRKQPRVFRTIVQKIRVHGLEQLPSSNDLNTGLAGETLHKTLFSTFNWVFQDLPSISSDYGVAAQLLLPIMSAIGVTSVDRETLTKALEWLVSFVDTVAESEFRQSAQKIPWLSQLIDNIAPSGEPKCDEASSKQAVDCINAIYNWTNQSDADLRRGRMDDVVALLSQWMRSPSNKDDRISRRDCLTWHLTERLSDEHCSEPERHWGEVLIERLKETELDLEDEVSQLPWIQLFTDLTQSDVIDGAISCLNKHALIEIADDSDVYSVHPLIREFAFEERSRAKPITIGDTPSQFVAENGPSLISIYYCVLSILPQMSDSAESFLDLLPRLKRNRWLADFACDYLLRHSQRTVSSNWKLLERLYDEGLDLARDLELVDKQGRLLAEIGELRERLGYEDGLTTLEEATDVLSKVKDAASFRSYAWASAYLHRHYEDPNTRGHVHDILARLRNVQSHDLTTGFRSLHAFIEQHLKGHTAESPSFRQLQLSSPWSEWLAHAVHDISELLLACFDGELSEGAFHKSSELATLAYGALAAGRGHNAFIDPEQSFFLELGLLCGRHYFALLTDSQFNTAIERLLAEANECGFNKSKFAQHVSCYQWTWFARKSEWDRASAVAEKWMAEATSMGYRREEFEALEPRLKLAIVRLASKKCELAELAKLSSELDSIEGRCRFWGRNELAGWLLLGRSLLYAQASPADRERAVLCAMQAWQSFRRYKPCVSAPAGAVYDRVVQMVNDAQPACFEHLRDKLADRVNDPPDFRSWLIDSRAYQYVKGRNRLAERVRSKRDGKTLRLVMGGLQCSLDHKEGWLYPFYIDEEPVSVSEFERFAREKDREFEFEGDESGLAGVTDPQWAQAYAEWAGRQLPNVHEWYSAIWQQAFNHTPEQWDTWEQSETQILNRIERAIKKEIECPHAPLPERTFDLEDHQREVLQYYWSAKWITTSPRLSDLVHGHIAQRISDHEESFSDDVTQGFAYGLASSISLTWEEKGRIVAAIPKLSKFQIEELVRILAEERAKFSELDERHFDHLLALGWRHRNDFIQLLFRLEVADMDSIDAKEVFTTSPPPPGAPAQPATPTPKIDVKPMIFSANEYDLKAVWSCMKRGWEEEPEFVLLGDPFKDAEWTGGGRILRHNFLKTNGIGIRCVLPIFTADDLDLVEPIE